ncbi:hypothetical protein AVEN_271053-1 [Araneus ventricosus]|uniref:Uncharacterized protein n=1 Tax=Araneus ventricosus TaxID=182803 RepID=A0A4Y2FF95_ARAVE|nr:hypothetical protein AVEN_271053-1 [Araneus ventricosus]
MKTAGFLQEMYSLFKGFMQAVRSPHALKFPQEETSHKPFLGLEEKEPRCLSTVIKLQTTSRNRRQKTPHRVGHLRHRQRTLKVPTLGQWSEEKESEASGWKLRSTTRQIPET